jgi:hypothetical protein
VGPPELPSRSRQQSAVACEDPAGSTRAVDPLRVKDLPEKPRYCLGLKALPLRVLKIGQEGSDRQAAEQWNEIDPQGKAGAHEKATDAAPDKRRRKTEEEDQRQTNRPEATTGWISGEVQISLDALHQEWSDAYTDGRAKTRFREYSGETDSAEQSSPLIPLPTRKTRIVVPAESEEQKPACDETADKSNKLHNHLLPGQVAGPLEPPDTVISLCRALIHPFRCTVRESRYRPKG